MTQYKTVQNDWEQALIEDYSVKGNDLKRYLEVDHLQILMPYLQPSNLIIESGSGLGKWVYAFQARGFKTIGLDFSYTLVESSHRRGEMSDLKQNPDWLQSDIMQLPIKDATVDCYLSFGVIEHFSLDQQEQIVSEMARTLKTGGIAYFYVPYYWSLYTLRREITYRFREVFPPKAIWQRHFKMKEIQVLCEKYNFEMQELKSFYAGHALKQALYPPLGTEKLAPKFIRTFSKSIIKKLGIWLDNRNMMGYNIVYIGKKSGS